MWTSGSETVKRLHREVRAWGWAGQPMPQGLPEKVVWEAASKPCWVKGAWLGKRKRKKAKTVKREEGKVWKVFFGGGCDVTGSSRSRHWKRSEKTVFFIATVYNALLIYTTDFILTLSTVCREGRGTFEGLMKLRHRLYTMLMIVWLLGWLRQ